MRTFYIACAILLTIIIVIIINSCYVINKINTLLELCTEIENSGSPDSKIELIISEWQDCRGKLSISISHNEIERAENSLYLFSSYNKTGDTANFIAQLESFKNALEHISDAQKFSLENIF